MTMDPSSLLLGRPLLGRQSRIIYYDVLSVGPMRPLLFAAPLGGARGHDDDMIQANSLRDEWSGDSWTAGDPYGASCAQLDNFDWVMPACYPVGVLPRLEEEDSMSDI